MEKYPPTQPVLASRNRTVLKSSVAGLTAEMGTVVQLDPPFLVYRSVLSSPAIQPSFSLTKYTERRCLTPWPHSLRIATLKADGATR